MPPRDPEDRFSDYPQATAVIVDLSTGERMVDTTDGMGDPDEDDLAHDYPEVYLSDRFLDNDSAFVEGLGDDTSMHCPAARETVDTSTWASAAGRPDQPRRRLGDRGPESSRTLVATPVGRTDSARGAPMGTALVVRRQTVVGIAICGPGAAPNWA